MPDRPTRLYALRSTPTYHAIDAPGPSLLINDPLVAMRWYFAHEREQFTSVAAQVSDDEGVTWKFLLPHTLWADAQSALAQWSAGLGPVGRAARPMRVEERVVYPLREALAADAARWLDHRIRFVDPDDPQPWIPSAPTGRQWAAGGEAWALALGEAPIDDVLEYLTTLYGTSQPDGPQALGQAATRTVEILDRAESLGHTTTDLLNLLRETHVLVTYRIELSQLQGRAQQAWSTVSNALAARLPETAAALAAYPDPAHPARQAVNSYVRALAVIGPDSHEEDTHDRLALARAALEQVLTRATVPHAAEAPPAAVPGFPQMMDDLQAAAAWRRISPEDRREAEEAMGDLVRAQAWLAEAAVSRAAGHGTWARTSGEHEAIELQSAAAARLQHMSARHALLMHATIYGEAEVAAEVARRAPFSAAEHVALPYNRERQGSFEQHLQETESRIDQVLAWQRAFTRAAQRRLARPGTRGLLSLDRVLVANASMVNEARETLNSLESALRAREQKFAGPRVTEEQVAKARHRFDTELRRQEEVQQANAVTAKAVSALRAASEPPGSNAAYRAKRIAQAARERLRQQQAHTRPRYDQHNQHAALHRADPGRHMS
ncbi:hypothetical protein [Streptomyces sp. NPDC056304]|uniref:hypothetical protein n=1 Tax=Streptomyces sp. NPDC056304 TaxID=3345778 RepID=UPI0035DEDE9F